MSCITEVETLQELPANVLCDARIRDGKASS